MALIDGAGDEAQYADARVNDPAVVALRGRVHAVADKGIALEAVRAKLTLKDGTTRALDIEHCVGSIGLPMTDAQLDEKFRAQCDPVLGKQRSAAALSQLWRADALDDLAPCAAACAAG